MVTSVTKRLVVQKDQLNRQKVSVGIQLKRPILWIDRLNSGIFRISDPRKLNLNLKCSDCRAFRIIWNDTKLGPISWQLNIENTLFSICVGVWVGDHFYLLNFLSFLARQENWRLQPTINTVTVFVYLERNSCGG